MVPLVAFLGGMVVEGRVNARASLMASGKPGGWSSGQPESTSAGRVENLGAADKFMAGHGGHGFSGGGQGGGCGSGGGRETCFASVLPSVVRRGAINKLLGPSRGRQPAPSLPKVDVVGFCPGDRWGVRFFVR